MSQPRLIPAFKAQFAIKAPGPIGSVARGNTLVHVEILPEVSTLVSEPGYAVSLDATIVHGADYIGVDPSGKTARLEVHSVVKDKTTGALVRLTYTGVVDLASPNGKVLTGAADAATTEFGNAFTHVVFETGSPELALLQHKVYVGSGRFILEQGKPAVVEYKISEVAH